MFLPLIFGGLRAADVVIHEMMADNETILADSDGDFHDWIELFNDSSVAISLDGWYLTDDSTDLTKWTFPSQSIGAGQYLIVFASGKSPTSLDGGLHTNFKLNRKGGYLALVRPDGITKAFEIADYPTQQTDQSYGLPQDALPATENLYPLATPTPNAANTTSLVAPIYFSETSRFFSGTLNIILGTGISNASIHYTLDGSTPETSDPLYTTPIPINSITTIKAKVFYLGGGSSDEVVHRYIPINADVQSFETDLPLLLIETFGADLNNKNSTHSAFFTLTEQHPVSGRTKIIDQPEVASRVSMQVRGSSSSNFAKKQWKFEIQDEQGNDFATSLLGMPSESDWVLYNPGNYDRALVNNAFIYDLANRMGHYAPRTRFVEVYINNNGGTDLNQSDYYGIYLLVEKIKRDDDRTDVEKLLSTDNTAPEVTGGYVLKIDRKDPGDNGFKSNNNIPSGCCGVAFNYVDPKESEVTSAQANYIQTYINDLEAALYGPDWQDESLGYYPFIDLDNWIDYHIVNVMAHNVDCLRLSTYLHKYRNGPLRYGPQWDFDRALESTDGRDDNPVGWSYYNNYDWWDRLFDDPNFTVRWADRWFEMRRGILSTDSLDWAMDSLANILHEAAPRESNRWYAWRHDSLYGEVQHVQDWLKNRCEWLDTEFLGPPDFSQEGGVVSNGFSLSLSNPYGGDSIYFTLDGTDPRLHGGGIAPTAVAYTGPLSLSGKGVVFVSARIKAGTDWGAICRFPFQFPEDYSGLVINEIHYHPADSLGKDGDAYEFVELINDAADSVNLTNVSFSNGIRYSFPAGSVLPPDSMLVLAVNGADFENLYGFAPFDEYGGSLANGGEKIVLLDPSGNELDEVDYDDKAPWANEADGKGSSLELIAPELDNSLAESWFASFILGGTPGRQNSRFCEGGPDTVVVTEIMYHYDFPLNALQAGDWLELYNPGTNPIQLDGWRLQDQDSIYVLPAGLTLAGGAYLVLAGDTSLASAAHPNLANVLALEGMKLNNGGENILLVDDAGCLIDQIAYDDNNAWPEAADGQGPSLSLPDASTDNRDANNWSVSAGLSGSPGGPHLGNCSVAPNQLVINEINYKSGAADSKDWIEIYNPGSASIDMSGWEMHDENNFYTLPAATTIAANGFLVIAQDLTAFQTIYPGVGNVVGGWDFGLGGGGEYVALLTDQRCLVDILKYNDAPPWDPDAEGNGLTLSLISADRDNELAGSWIAYPPTPGTPNGIPEPCQGNTAEIVISEIYYNSPPNVDAGNWLELYNPGLQAVDLSAWELHADDTSYVLPPISIASAGYMVLVEDSGLFSSFYGISNFVGNMGFGLENGRDQILLYSSGRCLVDSLVYEGKKPWDPDADGFGPSLALTATNAANEDPTAWEAGWGSGTPGQNNAVNLCTGLAGVVINEVNYNSPALRDAGDWIELHNVSPNPVDLSNWTLRAGKDRYFFPSNTVLPANGFLVLVNDSAKFESIHTGISNFMGEIDFALDNGGEFLALYNERYCIIDSFHYDDMIPWPEEADGQGSSMALLDPFLDNGRGENWYGEKDGTPGQANDPICGPGGESDVLRMWLRADDYGGLLLDNSPIANWQDLSGLGSHATQNEVGDQPSLQRNEMNGHAVVRFDGTTDWLRINDAVSTLVDSFTLFTVFRPEVDNDDGYYLSTHNGGSNRIKFGHRVNGELIYDDDVISLSTDIFHGQAVMTGFRLVPNASIAGYVNGANGNNLNGGFSNTGADRASIGQEFDGQGNDNQTSNHWKADLAEMILLKGHINETKRFRIETYLAIRYGLSIPVSHHQYYDHLSHPHGQAGIGIDILQCLEQSSSQSESDGSILMVGSAADLENGEFLAWGHDGYGTTQAMALSDGPAGLVERMARTWAFSKTGETGSVNLSFDLNGLGWDVSDSVSWVLLVDNDQNWSDASILPINPTIEEGILVFPNVSIEDGMWISLGRREYLQLDLQAILQGGYDFGKAEMRDDLRSKGFLPLTDPYLGTQTTDLTVLGQNGNQAIVDWVLVELRDPNDPTNIVLSLPALLRVDGQIVSPKGEEQFLVSPFPLNGTSYYLSLRHRNHLGVMSEAPLSLETNKISLDFRSGDTPVNGEHARKELSPGLWALWAGDANGDGKIQFQGGINDASSVFLSILSDPGNTSFARNYVQSGYHRADVNLDGVTIFQGASSETSGIFLNILSHPSNSSFQRNYVISAALP
ncbi:MAG: lamin tail domain-containing protein [Bacteroidota bacterium]